MSGVGRALPAFTLRGWSRGDIADPYPVYRRFREVAPVQRADPDGGGTATYYVFSHPGVATVLTSRHCGRSPLPSGPGTAADGLVPGRFATLRDLVDNWLVFLDPPRHTRVRSLLATEFSPAVAAGLRPRIEVIAGDLIAQLRRRSVVDVVAEFAAPLPILVISELLGVAADRREWLRAASTALQEASSSRAAARDDAHDVADAAARRLSAFFAEQLDARRREPGPDLISLLALAQACEVAPLSDTEIIATCVHLLTAGHETTTNLLAKSVLALLANPDALDELRSDPTLLPGAVDELVRYDPPVQAVSRWVHRDLQVDRHRVPAGSKVVALLGSANRDPARWSDPDRLDLHRPPGQHLGFGMGIHYCLGASLARAEAEIGLRSLLDLLPDVTATPGPVDYADDMIFHGPSRLTVALSA
ncbi:cytochrome P450 [Pseudonocardia xinjiangensis]|uniref:cytochrome P450 n=1 Tax=Pseudonocardia xinjiangensis TaxID=75289 RepID=UPI003D9044F6